MRSVVSQCSGSSSASRFFRNRPEHRGLMTWNVNIKTSQSWCDAPGGNQVVENRTGSSLPRPAALRHVGRSRALMHADASVEFPAHPSALMPEAKRPARLCRPFLREAGAPALFYRSHRQSQTVRRKLCEASKSPRWNLLRLACPRSTQRGLFEARCDNVFSRAGLLSAFADKLANIFGISAILLTSLGYKSQNGFGNGSGVPV